MTNLAVYILFPHNRRFKENWVLTLFAEEGQQEAENKIAPV